MPFLVSKSAKRTPSSVFCRNVSSYKMTPEIFLETRASVLNNSWRAFIGGQNPFAWRNDGFGHRFQGHFLWFSEELLEGATDLSHMFLNRQKDENQSDRGAEINFGSYRLQWHCSQNVCDNDKIEIVFAFNDLKFWFCEVNDFSSFAFHKHSNY
uniref:Uncharacterized protein n=1 Tax=Romanomermis culicivorax TaxID=13658 RepID=A0A915IHT1_ROMCU